MKRRLCHEVITEMLAHVPQTNTDLIEALAWNYNDSLYKAPEETLQWEKTMKSLQTFIPKPVEDWEFKVLSIFTTKTVEELKQLSK